MQFSITWVIFQQFSRRDVNLVAFLIIFHLLSHTSPLIPKLHGKMKQKLTYYEVESRPKNQFSFYLITLYSNVSQFVVSLLSIMVTFWVAATQDRFFEAKRLCQQIKHVFVVCISFWRIENLYKEMDVIRSLFKGYNHVICIEWHMIMVGDEDCQWWLLQRDAE